jgi:hypothetical protein
MTEQPDALQHLLTMATDNAQRMEANRQASLLVDFALLSFLVDAKIATIDQICQRIGVIHGAMRERYQTDDVKQRLLLVTEWLRSHEKKPVAGWKPEVIQGGLDQSKDDDPTLPKE